MHVNSDTLKTLYLYIYIYFFIFFFVLIVVRNYFDYHPGLTLVLLSSLGSFCATLVKFRIITFGLCTIEPSGFPALDLNRTLILSLLSLFCSSIVMALPQFGLFGCLVLVKSLFILNLYLISPEKLK